MILVTLIGNGSRGFECLRGSAELHAVPLWVMEGFSGQAFPCMEAAEDDDGHENRKSINIEVQLGAMC
jgi:hypothetical protein